MTKLYSEKKEADSLRAINRSNILNLLSTKEPMARNQISEHIGLTGASVTRIINECIGAQLVVEKKNDSISISSGRRPIPLSLNDRTYFVACVHIGNFWIDIGLMNLLGEISDFIRLDRPESAEAVLELIVEHIKKLNTGDKTVLCIGITLYGKVDIEKGTILDQNVLGWENVPIVSIFENQLQIKTVIDTNVHSMAVTAYKAQPLPQDHALLFINVGTTIGMAIVVNNTVIRGKQGQAGILEHIPWDPQGPLCECGKRGCLTSLLTDRAILSRAKGLHLPVTFNNIHELIAHSTVEPALTQLLRERARRLGEFLAHLSLIHDPSRIVLAGTCTNDELPQLDWVQKSYENTIDLNDRAYAKIELPKHQQNIPFTLTGAGTIALQTALSPALKLINDTSSTNGIKAALPL
ncbi:ROK family protein [Alkalihalobacillus oceani]|uniref:ROK family protein n=1 Tax=Halalkalibacter oceani TaxID=1653776 RepID=A0A9X2DUF9_9BACI|nr:ROK family protein [Halalkalibacter oceani]MCM3715648.1 ROK family protein [Halalkalibacter oceani]